MQRSKTVYFRDYPKHAGVRSGLTIPFPDAELDVYRFVESLSSYAVRQLMGFESFEALERAAQRAESPVASYARALIRDEASHRASSGGARSAMLQATFRGGRGSPLHDWYPYLEGYSPEFVSSIVREFAPEAHRILDPFCGSGTTALVTALSGREGLYAEVNPVCRYIIEAKALALKLDRQVRDRIGDALVGIAETLPRELKKVRPDRSLSEAFDLAFGQRPFFDRRALNNILRVRTLIDTVDVKEPVLARFFTVAAVRSLVPGSLLVRRGDLRFKTERELASDPPDFLGVMRESLHIIASDLADATLAPGSVQFVCSDARSLHEHLRAPVDAVITSPPYLNGTNYFRNTKIELWFLRCLSSKQELRRYRDAAITAGINDVTLSKTEMGSYSTPPPLLTNVLRDLRENAYDQRIPLMVQSYFQEMNLVIAEMAKVLAPKGVVAIDLGDSCYGDVWVPTDEILAQAMESNGFERKEKIALRERQSRDGRKLSQTLQVFALQQSAGKRARGHASDRSTAMKKWIDFRTQLPHQRGDMAKRNWGHPWHSLCSYQGKLKPSIAHVLVKALLPKAGGRLLDPFSGVGTIPFEGRLQGHVAYGFDISPAAATISRAKLAPVEKTEVSAALERLSRWIRKHANDDVDLNSLSSIKFNGPLPSYFHEKTLREIVAARNFFQRYPAVSGSTSLVKASLLHILHGNRPYALSRRSHPITPFAPTGPSEYRPLMDRLRKKVGRCLEELATTTGPVGTVFFQDVMTKWPSEVTELDAIITSPPFFDSTRFHTANWMRLWFAGWDGDDFASMPAAFVDERQKRSLEVYDSIFAQGSERLRRSGYFAVHLGKSTKCDMAAELSVIGKRHLRLVDVFSESVEHCESHGIRDKGTVTHHQYLLFQKA